MIREVNEKDVLECVKVIRDSFATVADEFGFTIANAPRFTAFATTEDRLKYHLLEEHRPMYAFYDKEDIVGYYSLFVKDNKECELNNLSVMPANFLSGLDVFPHFFCHNVCMANPGLV